MDVMNICISLLAGVVSGLFASGIFLILQNTWFRPIIKISKDIAYKKSTETREVVDQLGNRTQQTQQITIYRIKISNETEDDAYDVSVYVRIIYKGKSATIKLPYLPILHGKTKNDQFNNERQFPFSMTDIRLSTIKNFDDAEILQKYQSGTLELTDFQDRDTIFEVILFATDSKSGAIQRVHTIKRSFEEVQSSLKAGDFAIGQLIVAKQQYEPRPDDHYN